MSNTQHIQEAVDTILATRDFCGDEQQALRDVQADRRIHFTTAEKKEIWAKVNGTWRECQKACEAKILTSHERQAACKALEDDESDWTPEHSRRLRMNHSRNNSNFEE